jgi:methionine-R-sulfoxide reductase
LPELSSPFRNCERDVIGVPAATAAVRHAETDRCRRAERGCHANIEEPLMRRFFKDPDIVANLSAQQYRVTQNGATEMPGTGKYLDNEEPGIYVDIVSGEPLFASSDKFDSGSGWPSFTKPIEPANINELADTAHGLISTEVRSVHRR